MRFVHKEIDSEIVLLCSEYDKRLPWYPYNKRLCNQIIYRSLEVYKTQSNLTSHLISFGADFFEYAHAVYITVQLKE